MKKFLTLLTVALVILGFASPSLAGPSRALVQELGSVIGADEINVDLDWVGQKLNVLSTGDTTVGGGGATIGSMGLSSVNIGITQALELRLGRLPGFRSDLTLPAANANNLGLTLKGAGLVPGLGYWIGYGSSSLSNTASASSSGSSLRVGAAYTWAGPLILNLNLGYGQDTAGGVANNTTNLDAAGAALYPLKSNLIVGVELLYTSVDIGGGTKIGVMAPALGARATAGNWTIDAVAALLGTSVSVTGQPSNASATVIGVPNLRINYKL
ncbi:MAG: hypothetical protein HYR79_11205 [Nitrospirae bacterium]|nr:hypothetical protein [Nitrospirota bacterium]